LLNNCNLFRDEFTVSVLGFVCCSGMLKHLPKYYVHIAAAARWHLAWIDTDLYWMCTLFSVSDVSVQVEWDILSLHYTL